MGITNYIPSSQLIQPGVIDNTAARPASPFEGQVIFQKDTDQLLVWNGTAWVMFADADTPPGLQLVGTYSINSWVNQITNIFTSEFTNYRAVVSYVVSSANAVYLRWLVGTTVQTGNILSQVISSQLSVGTVTASSRSDQYGLMPTAYTTYPSKFSMDIFSPQTSTYTSYNVETTTIGVSSTDSYIAMYSGRNIATTQIDGMEITTANGSAVLTGTVSVYGYRK